MSATAVTVNERGDDLSPRGRVPSELDVICLVLGMHRSGTSALAGILHHSGVSMGTRRTFFPHANEENPFGFYEDVRFRLLNDALLAAAGYRVKSWRRPLPELTDPRLAAPLMRRLVDRRERHRHPWGWKDPRQLLTLGPWRQVLEGLGADVRIVWVYREPTAVARSMIRRSNVADPDEAKALVDAYTVRALTELEAWQPRLRIVYFHALLREPMVALKPVSALLEHDIPADVVERVLHPPSSGGDADRVEPTPLLSRLVALER